MVKQVERRRVEYKLGRIRVSIEDIILVLTKKNLIDFKAKNGDYIFEGLEDLKAHSELAIGNPRFDFGDVTLSFGKYGTEIDTYTSKQEDIDIAASLYASLKQKKSLESKLRDYQFTFFLTVAIVTPTLYLIGNSSDNNLKEIISTVLSILLIPYMFLFFRLMYLDFLSDTVYVERPANLLKRIGPQIITSVVTATIVLVLTALLRDWLPWLK